jgi:hypothetical protein
MSLENTPIEDPLAWQALTNKRGPVNTFGSQRFWLTAQERGLAAYYRDGAPGFSSIVFDIGDGIGVKLSIPAIEENIEEGTMLHMEYRFVDLADYEENT